MKEALATEPVVTSAANVPEQSLHQKDVLPAEASSGLFVQTKLSVGAPDDPFEREADWVADQVMRIPERNFLEHNSTTTNISAQSQSLSPNISPIIQRQQAATQQVTLPSITSQIRYRPSGVITRTEFDRYVTTYYGVTNVHTGTQSEQEQRLTRHGVPAATIANWQSWDPGSASEDYTSIINGMEDMLTAIGAMPQVNTILFFQRQYEPDPTTGAGIPNPTTGASFGAGELTIYSAFSGSTHPAIGVNTSTGAPTNPPNRSADISYNIIHELGHGVGEAGSNNSRQMFDQFNATVGWIGSPSVLYDMGQPSVLAAITNSTSLPSQHIITPGRWNDPSVREQPMSQYAVQGGPGEDFAESVAAYISNPSALQQRSPLRYQFINSNIASWTPRMRGTIPALVQPPKGDFNLPTGNTRIA